MTSLSLLHLSRMGGCSTAAPAPAPAPAPALLPMKITVDDLDVFQRSGPTYLSESQAIWTHPNSLRAALGCLIQAVYALEKDRSVVKMGLNALAPDWWRPFRYKRVRDIHGGDSERGDQIVGAVFKWRKSLSFWRPAVAPNVVVAFRGTMPQGDTMKSDLNADWFLMLLKLHTSVRFSGALKAIEDAISRYGVEEVCITGHSLGAAVCLMAGRDLAERGCFVNTHLFNPPFPSFTSGNSRLQSLHKIALNTLISLLYDDQQTRETRDKFMALKKWHPHLYVNSYDPICKSYIAYFNNRQFTVEKDGSGPVQLASAQSLRALLQSMFGDAKPFHLIPSAHLHVVETGSKKFLKVHGMKQWWSSETKIHSNMVGLDLQEL